MTSEVPLRVLGDRVLIRPDVEEQVAEVRESGLYTAPTLAAAVEGSDRTIWYTTGTIVDVGVWPPDAKHVALTHLRAWLRSARYAVHKEDVAVLAGRLEALPAERVRDYRVGDRVTFSVQAGQDVTVNGESYVIMHDKDLLAVIEG